MREGSAVCSTVGHAADSTADTYYGVGGLNFRMRNYVARRTALCPLLLSGATGPAARNWDGRATGPARDAGTQAREALRAFRQTAASSSASAAAVPAICPACRGGPWIGKSAIAPGGVSCRPGCLLVLGNASGAHFPGNMATASSLSEGACCASPSHSTSV